MRQDPAVRKAFREQMQIHALLGWRKGVVKSHHSEVRVISRRFKKLKIPSSNNAASLAAAALMLLSLMGWLFWSHLARQNAPQFITIESSTASNFTVGQSLPIKELVLNEGSIAFRMSSGASVEVSAPCQLTLLNALHLRITNGSISVNAGIHGHGFTVDTDNAHIVDIGTKFGVSHVLGGETSVTVFFGTVDVYQAQSETQTTAIKLARMNEGEALKIDATHQITRIRSLTFHDNGTNSIQTRQEQLVTEVRDNIKTDTDFRFYSIIPGGMKTGANAYTNNPKTGWWPEEGREFPASLQGADLISTYSQDRKDKDLIIYLRVTKPCMVSVMLDTRGPVPSWVESNYQNTGVIIRSGPWTSTKPITRDLTPDAGGNYYINYAVWTRVINSAGVVELGSPYVAGQQRERDMYGIAVKALP